MGLRFLAYTAGDVAMLPVQITAAAQGDYEPVMQIIATIFAQSSVDGLDISCAANLRPLPDQPVQ